MANGLQIERCEDLKSKSLVRIDVYRSTEKWHEIAESLEISVFLEALMKGSLGWMCVTCAYACVVFQGLN